MPDTLARRSLLGLAASLACPLCTHAWAADAPEWGYEGASGPDHWGELSADFRTCGMGTQQSPINLTGVIKATLGPVAVGYKKAPLRVWHNGYYMQCNMPAGNKVTVAGISYELLQFHFHHPSEHRVDGKRFDMEAHFVNKAADGSVCALGMFIEPGRANPVLGAVVEAMPSEPGPEKVVSGVTVDPMQLFPRNRSYFRYMGSLTTPPCSETLNWVVFRTPIEASPEQIKRYATVFPLDARPIQPTNRRFVLEAGV